MLRNRKVQIGIAVFIGLLIISGIFYLGVKTRPNDVSEVPVQVASSSAKVATKSAEEEEKEEVKGTTTNEVYTPLPEPNAKNTTRPKVANETRKYLGLKIEALDRALGEMGLFLEKSKSDVPYFPIPYLDNADAELNKSISYNSKIKPKGSLETSAFNNCKGADDNLKFFIIAYRGWAYHTYVGEFSKAIETFDAARMFSDKYYDFLDDCSGDLINLWT